MSSITPVSASPAYAVATTAPKAPSSTPASATPAVSDPDHDGDTDTPGKVDTYA